MNDKNKFKVFLLGDWTVGKTNLLFRISPEIFEEREHTKMADRWPTKTFQIDRKFVTLEIWDTYGQEKFGSVVSMYYKSAQGILLVYSIDNSQSFQHVRKWFEDRKKYTSENIPIILVGNKCDLENERVIPFEEGKALADSLGISFMETSAKNDINVTEVFTSLASEIMMKHSEIFFKSDTKNEIEVKENSCLLL